MKSSRSLLGLVAALVFAAAALPAPAQTVTPSNSAGGVTKVAGQDGSTRASASNPLPVMGDVAMITVTPTVSASPAYSSGDAMGGLMTFSNAALRSGGGGLIQAVTVHFKTAQTAPVDFLWCGASNLSSTTLTDNGAVNVATADFAACRAVHVTDCTSLGTPTVCSADNLAFPYVLATGTTGYGFLITRGSQTLGSTSDVSVSLRILRQ